MIYSTPDIDSIYISANKNRYGNCYGTLKTCKSINLSEIRKMFEMAGENSINLGLGEPDFNTPNHIIEAASTCHERRFHPLHIKHGDIGVKRSNNQQI